MNELNFIDDTEKWNNILLLELLIVRVLYCNNFWYNIYKPYNKWKVIKYEKNNIKNNNNSLYIYSVY